MSTIRNEQLKYLATAFNNLGVASIVTGGIAPAAATLLGSLPVGNIWRLAAVVAIWVTSGVLAIAGAQRVLRSLA